MKNEKTGKEACLWCGKDDRIEVIYIDAGGVYRGEWINYTAAYDRCEWCDKLWESEEFSDRNRKARHAAYEKKITKREARLW